MRNLSQDWDVLDLTDAEGKTLWALLEGGTQSVSSVARRAHVPRTTVDAALRRLHERKLARLVRTPLGRGHRRFWRASKVEKVHRELTEVVSPFQERQKVTQKVLQSEKKVTEITENRGILENIDAEELGIYAFHGKQQVLAAYESMIKMPKKGKISFIQGNISANIALKDADKQYLLDFREKIKKSAQKTLQIEGFNGEQLLKLLEKASVQALQSHKERMKALYVLPDPYLNFGLDIAIFPQSVLFIDVEQESVVLVTNDAICQFFSRIALLFHDSARIVDLNEYIRGIVAGKRIG